MFSDTNSFYEKINLFWLFVNRNKLYIGTVSLFLLSLILIKGDTIKWLAVPVFFLMLSYHGRVEKNIHAAYKKQLIQQDKLSAFLMIIDQLTIVIEKTIKQTNEQLSDNTNKKPANLQFEDIINQTKTHLDKETKLINAQLNNAEKMSSNNKIKPTDLKAIKEIQKSLEKLKSNFESKSSCTVPQVDIKIEKTMLN